MRPLLKGLAVASLRELEPLLARIAPAHDPANDGLVRETIHLLRLVTADANCVAVALAYVCCDAEAAQSLPLTEEQRELLRQVRSTEMISDLTPRGMAAFQQSRPQVEHLRRMVLEISRDMRVLLIKIAERGGRLLQLRHRDRRAARQVAREVFRIHVPIAGRLGFYALKSELEDLCLATLSPRVSRQIEALLARDKEQRKRYVDEFAASLHLKLEKAGVGCEVSARAKNVYSIYRKLRRKKLQFSGLCDAYGVRILVGDEAECYQALGLVHSWWRHLRGEFDDYVGNAKPNGYQSIHTAIVGPDGEIIEVQIRTKRMHEESEVGAAAHGGYKGDRYFNPWYEEHVAPLRRLASEGEASGDDLAELFALDEATKKIYVYTPEGDILELPGQATILDCAYAIHTDLGHRCVGGKINGDRFHPIRRALRSGEQVEILTAEADLVNEDWLRPDDPAVRTALGRQRVREALKRQFRDQARDKGEAVAATVLRRLDLPAVSLKRVASKLSADSVEELFVRLGEGRADEAALRRELKRLKPGAGGGA